MWRSRACFGTRPYNFRWQRRNNAVAVIDVHLAAIGLDEDLARIGRGGRARLGGRIGIKVRFGAHGRYLVAFRPDGNRENAAAAFNAAGGPGDCLPTSGGCDP